MGWLSEKGVVPLKNPGTDPKASRDGMARGFYEKDAKKGMPEAMDAVGRLYAAYNMLKEERPYLKKLCQWDMSRLKNGLKCSTLQTVVRCGICSNKQ